MSVVTLPEAWPARGRPFTVANLARMPDDGRRYELMDGLLIVSPRPSTVHQLAAFRLAVLLSNSCPEGLCVLPEPAVTLSNLTEFDPDVVVVRQHEIGGLKFTTPPLLIVEVRSPSTAIIDLNRKKAAYERFGVESYWVVVPDLDKPELVVFELRDGCYREAAHVTGEGRFAAGRPFRVDVVPSVLVAGVPRG
jgi:Uma2 family endonuclease